MAIREDLYGLPQNDISQQRVRIERALNVTLAPASSEFWGEHFIYRNSTRATIRLQPNVEGLDGEPLETQFSKFPVLLYVEHHKRADEIEAHLRATLPEIRLLRTYRDTALGERNFLDNTRTGYDNLAEEYAAHIFNELEFKSLDRMLLDRFGEMVKPLGIAVDMGCGPGQIAHYLHARGIPVIGVDLSPEMVRVAQRLNPEIHFQTGNMLALDW